MSENESSFQVGHKYELLSSRTDKAYFVPKSDWNHLKERIGIIGSDANVFYSFGGIAAGASITAITAACQTPTEDEKSAAFSVWLTCGIFLFVISIICFIVGKRDQRLVLIQSKDVVNQMKAIEDRFEDGKARTTDMSAKAKSPF
ncbi:MAG: hypothetical protein NUW37_02855 [Planctomycetes bacterium]|nr:hypothetical protein [Planctomycetota bacterium]